MRNYIIRVDRAVFFFLFLYLKWKNGRKDLIQLIERLLLVMVSTRIKRCERASETTREIARWQIPSLLLLLGIQSDRINHC